MLRSYLIIVKHKIVFAFQLENCLTYLQKYSFIEEKFIQINKILNSQ